MKTAIKPSVGVAVAVIKPTLDGLVLCERAPGVSIDEILARTSAELIHDDEVPFFRNQIGE